MPTIVRDYHGQLIETMRDLGGRPAKWWASPINLGGVPGEGGGSGIPIGGMYGQLIQSKVAYDTSELAYSGLLSAPPSGSLVDNLAHMRFAVSDTGSLATISNPTYHSIQDMQNLFHSAGYTSGAVITISGNLITVGSGTGFIRSINSALSTLSFFDWTTSGFLIPTGSTKYIGIEYNGGSPILNIRDTNDFNNNDEFSLVTVICESDDNIEISEHRQAVGDHAGRMIQRMHDTMHIERASHLGGIIIDETGTRNILVSAGKLWMGLSDFDINAIDTSVSDTFDRYYSDGGSGWEKEASQTQWNNTQYDDGTGVLATLTANKYSCQYFYVETDGELISLYGQNQYNTLTTALEETAPDPVPDRASEHAILIGRIVFKKNDSVAQRIQSTFLDEFGFSGASQLNDLTDVTLVSLADQDLLVYDSGTGQWVNTKLIGRLALGEDGEIITNKWLDIDGSLTGSAFNYGMASTPSVSSNNAIIGGLFRGDVDAGVSATEIRNIVSSTPLLGIGASVTTAYGLWINHINVATGNNYAIYTHSGLLSFGHDIEFRQQAEISTTTGDLTIAAASNLLLDTEGSIILDGPSDPIIVTTVNKYLKLTAGGNSGVYIQATSDEFTIINVSGIDTDTVIRGSSDNNLLYADAGTDRIGIGIAIPLEKLHVEGAIRTTSYLDYSEISEPATPDSYLFRSYAKSNGKLYGKNDSGTEYNLTTSILEVQVFS